jgi:hypothetical protein
MAASCKKEDATNTQDFSDARYTVEVTGKWKTPEFAVPGGVHFTPVYGMIHNKETFLWKENTKASIGVENVAETGNPYPLVYEIDSAFAKGNSIALVAMTAPQPTGSSKVNIYCTNSYSYISLETMLAPTPDWFTGLSGFNLFGNNRWVTDTTVNLYAYDAGTEDGDVFGYNNPASSPQQNVHILSPLTASVLANGNSILAPIATVRFIKK